MKAVVFVSPGEVLRVQEINRPVIADDEMLVKVRHCGICGTDIHASREGPFMAPADTVFGHEFSGEIVELGAAVPASQFKAGDRVTSLPFIGDKTIGLGQIPGGYAEYVKVSPEMALVLPDLLSDLQGALVEPMAVGLHSVMMAESVARRNVLIIGAGPIGIAVAIWCRFFGAARVVISEMSRARISILKQFDFLDIVAPQGDVGGQFAELTGALPDIQFECVGAPGIIQQCIDRAPKAGIIMAIGVCDQPDTIVPLTAFSKELKLRWAVGYEKKDFEYTIAMMLEGRIDPRPMVTDIVSLVDVPQVFESLRTPTSQCKVMIDLDM